MEISSKEISKDLILSHLKTLFFKKGYPENFLFWEKIFYFNYNNLEFTVEITLVVEEKRPLLILNYHSSKLGLASFERPTLSIARLFFNPLPYFAVLTNLQNYILLEVYPQKIKKGGEELIPDYKTIRSYQPPFEKPFNKDIEEKILAFYLSGG
ncbi:MAG: hypothetical protein C0197_02645 [Caldimicrobium thiodismutans]|uniref:Type I restriction enzyme R protein N-terminal domain-containing protein n=1 Tax=Caldimicrobium thiodismutans TaxID=1653476 RepID=A0A2N7PK37_9BACT|nr:MAG: hypothetical protein C0197_02645 [Caldimicrobium thiodismutans]